ncbi:MAG: glycosyltransferase [Rugosibacter sp.]|nr:glycosyltransferase [Rugosibacter sp.]
MKFSLITTVFNESVSIVDFINCINNQTVLPDEIVIVDGGSTDDTISKIQGTIISKVPLKLIVDESCNLKHCIAPIAKGRNVAIEAASFEFILITDAGCILDKNWVLEMKKPFSDGFDVVSGNYTAKSGNAFQNYLADIFCPKISVVNPKYFLPSSRSLGVKKEIWRRVGGYPLNSYTAEDTKFDLLMFDITDKVFFAERAIVYWELPKSYGELWRKTYNYGVGDGIQRLSLFKYFFRACMVVFPLPYLILVAMRKKKLIGYMIYVAQVSGFVIGVVKGFQ